MNIPKNNTNFIKNTVFLAQSDTTAGFLSANPMRILEVKNSPKDKAILRESCNLAHIKNLSRIPRILQKHLRRTQKRTFIFDNNHSFRVIHESHLGNKSHTKGELNINLHHIFLKQFGTLFSSSANQKGKKFEIGFASNCADIIISDNRGIFEDTPSSIFRVKKTRMRQIR